MLPNGVYTLIIPWCVTLPGMMHIEDQGHGSKVEVTMNHNEGIIFALYYPCLIILSCVEAFDLQKFYYTDTWMSLYIIAIDLYLV